MADLGYIERELNALPANLRPAFLRIFQAILKDLRLGHPADRTAMTNFGGAWFETTTPAGVNTEFTIPHGFGRTPYLLLPVLPLDVQGAQLVPLTVSRVADDNRVYLKSSVASAPITVGVEG